MLLPFAWTFGLGTCIFLKSYWYVLAISRFTALSEFLLFPTYLVFLLLFTLCRIQAGIDPRCCAAWIGFGHAFAAQDESDQALSAYRTASRLCPGSHIPSLCMGAEYSRIGNMSLAKMHLNQSLSCSSDPLVFHELGVVSFKLGEYANALTMFQQCINHSAGTGTHETWVPTLINIAHSHRKLQNWDEALRYLHIAISIAPSNAATLAAVGLVHHMRGDIDLAIASYHKALALSPHDSLVNDLLNRALTDNVSTMLSHLEGTF